MDSIVKNIGKEYITAVSPSIVALFTHVFEQVNYLLLYCLFCRVIDNFQSNFSNLNKCSALFTNHDRGRNLHFCILE